METVVITGANRGIGLGLVLEFLANKAHVIAACRHPEEAAALRELAQGAALEILPLDVADDTSITNFIDSLAGKPIDILINNAGTLGGDNQSTSSMDYDAWTQAFVINTIAPFRLSVGLLANLKQSPRPRVISVSSQMGSLAGHGTDHYAYRSSKAALNKVMKSLAKDLEPSGVLVCPIHPGWVKTDMGGSNAQITVAQSAAGIYRLIDTLTAAKSGHFLAWDSEELPW
jgi:NAD(P)-dependent dehydrogenase (short-subunit alcohol dehydrogenase family)